MPLASFKSFKKKSILVIGLGRFGTSFAINSSQLGCEVVAVDEDHEKIHLIADQVTESISGNIHSDRFLKTLGIRNFDAIVVAIGNDIESSILLCTTLKELGAKYVVAKAAGDLHEKVLKKLGVDWVISVEKDMGQKAAFNLFSRKIIDSIRLDADYRILEITTPESWVGTDIESIPYFKQKDVFPILLKRGTNIIPQPKPETIVQDSDILVVCGRSNVIANFE